MASCHKTVENILLTGNGAGSIVGKTAQKLVHLFVCSHFVERVSSWVAGAVHLARGPVGQRAQVLDGHHHPGRHTPRPPLDTTRLGGSLQGRSPRSWAWRQASARRRISTVGWRSDHTTQRRRCAGACSCMRSGRRSALQRRPWRLPTAAGSGRQPAPAPLPAYQLGQFLGGRRCWFQ